MQRRIFLVTGAAFATAGLAGCDYLPWTKKPVSKGGSVSPNSFKGSVKAEWLTTPKPNDSFRDMKLLDTFGYVDPEGTSWDVPSGYVTNGASIPWGLWNIIGGPYDGPYRDAAVLHDYYCEKRLRPWDKTHKMYYDAALARGTTDNVASAMYAGLLLGGPRWGVAEGPSPVKRADALSWLVPSAHAQGTPAAPPPPPAPPAKKGDEGLTTRGTPANEAQKREFEAIQEWIKKEKPTPEQIAKRVEEVRKKLGMPTKTN